MDHHSIKVSEDDTHRSLVSKGSIPNHNYRHAKIVASEPILASSVEVQTSEKKNDHIWESCCLKTDKHAISYFGQLFVTTSVLGISTYMLVLADGECNRSSPWIGMISFLLGKILSSVVSSA